MRITLLVMCLGALLSNEARAQKRVFWNTIVNKYHKIRDGLNLPKSPKRARIEAGRLKGDPKAATVQVKKYILLPGTLENRALGSHLVANISYPASLSAVGQTFDVGKDTLLRIDAAVPHGRKSKRGVIIRGTLVSSTGKPLVIERASSFMKGIPVEKTLEGEGSVRWATGHPNRCTADNAPPSWVTYPSAKRVRFEVSVKPGMETLDLGAVGGQQLRAKVRVTSDGKVRLFKVLGERTEAGLLMRDP